MTVEHKKMFSHIFTQKMFPFFATHNDSTSYHILQRRLILTYLVQGGESGGVTRRVAVHGLHGCRDNDPPGGPCPDWGLYDEEKYGIKNYLRDGYKKEI